MDELLCAGKQSRPTSGFGQASHIPGSYELCHNSHARGQTLRAAQFQRAMEEVPAL